MSEVLLETAKKTLYEVLNINSNDSLEKIQDNFLSSVLKIHPKLEKFDAKTLTKFKNMIIAFETLSDDNIRNLYDEYLLKKNNNNKLLQEELSRISKNAEYIGNLNYAKFVRYLQYHYKIITPIRANALIGLVYEDIERELDNEQNIDPEDKEIKLYKEIINEFLFYMAGFILLTITTIIFVFVGGVK